MKLSAPAENFVSERLSAAPAAPVAGRRYYDTTLKLERYYDGTKWVDVNDVWVGPNAPLGTPAVGDLWYDTDDTTSTLALPLSVVNGGTGASSASSARSSLAVPAVGNSTTAAGAPTIGTWARGDLWLDSNNVRWMCTTGGTPGTWASMNIGEELAYNQTTTSTAITNQQGAAHLIVEGTTRAYDGTPIVVEVYSTLLQMPVNNAVMLDVWDGGTSLGIVCELWNNPTATAATVYGRRRLVPTAGTHNYRLAAWVNGGSATLYAGAGGGASQSPTFIRVTRA